MKPTLYKSPTYPDVLLEENPAMVIPPSWNWPEENWKSKVYYWQNGKVLQTTALAPLLGAHAVAQSPRLMALALLHRIFQTPAAYQLWLEQVSFKHAQFAGMQLSNVDAGREYLFCLNLGKQFLTVLERERTGGGITTDFVSQDPNGDWHLAILTQERLYQNQESSVDQVPGSYAVDPHPEAAFALTVQMVGQLPMTGRAVFQLFAPYNVNNANTVTIKDGIKVRLTKIPWHLLIPNENTEDGGYVLASGGTNEALERGIGSVVFRKLDAQLLLRVFQPSNDNPSEVKSSMAVTMAYMALILDLIPGLKEKL